MDRIEIKPLPSVSAERLDSLFRLYNGRVRASAAKRAKRPADVDDIAGLAWLKACVTVNRLQGPDSAALPWLLCITRRAAITYYTPKRSGEEPIDWDAFVYCRQLPAELSAEKATDVFAMVDLTARQAVCVKLAAQGLSQARIAARLERAPGTVYSHVHRGARKLRRAALALAG